MKDIATRRPADATAARVTQPGPKGYEPSKLILQVCSAVPLPLRPVLKGQLDLTGRTVGRLTVCGLTPKGASPNARGLWSCRCVCGYYTTRHAQAIQNPKNTSDCCERCRHVQHLRKVSTYRQTGVNADDQ